MRVEWRSWMALLSSIVCFTPRSSISRIVLPSCIIWILFYWCIRWIILQSFIRGVLVCSSISRVLTRSQISWIFGGFCVRWIPLLSCIRRGLFRSWIRIVMSSCTIWIVTSWGVVPVSCIRRIVPPSCICWIVLPFWFRLIVLVSFIWVVLRCASFGEGRLWFGLCAVSTGPPVVFILTDNLKSLAQ